MWKALKQDRRVDWATYMRFACRPIYVASLWVMSANPRSVKTLCRPRKHQSKTTSPFFAIIAWTHVCLVVCSILFLGYASIIFSLSFFHFLGLRRFVHNCLSITITQFLTLSLCVPHIFYYVWLYLSPFLFVFHFGFLHHICQNKVQSVQPFYLL